MKQIDDRIIKYKYQLKYKDNVLVDIILFEVYPFMSMSLAEGYMCVDSNINLKTYTEFVIDNLHIKDEIINCLINLNTNLGKLLSNDNEEHRLDKFYKTSKKLVEFETKLEYITNKFNLTLLTIFNYYGT